MAQPLTLDPVELRKLGQFSPALASLAALAMAEGVKNVGMLADDLEANRFPDEAGLLFIGAWQGDELLGIGGRTWCPDIPGPLRVRRFFVRQGARRKGIASLIAESLLSDAGDYCDLVTCNAGASIAAPPFWEALGFVRTDRSGITHVKHLIVAEPKQ